MLNHIICKSMLSFNAFLLCSYSLCICNSKSGCGCCNCNDDYKKITPICLQTSTFSSLYEQSKLLIKFEYRHRIRSAGISSVQFASYCMMMQYSLSHQQAYPSYKPCCYFWYFIIYENRRPYSTICFLFFVYLFPFVSFSFH